MTGQLYNNQTTIRQYREMIQKNNVISPRNQVLLNKIVRQLSLSLNKPLLEFTDILIESFMYPRGSKRSLINFLQKEDSCAIIDLEDEQKNEPDLPKFEYQDLGNAKILEMISIRQLILQTKSTDGLLPPIESSEYTPKLLYYMEEIHCLFIHLLKELSRCIEMPAYSLLYKAILTENLPHFHHTFQGFKELNGLFHCLLDNVKETGCSDEKIFHVSGKIMDRFEQFSNDNRLWFDDLIMGSSAFKEYLLCEDRILSASDDKLLRNGGIPPQMSKAIHDIKFEVFLETRKAKLRIAHRRVL